MDDGIWTRRTSAFETATATDNNTAGTLENLQDMNLQVMSTVHFFVN